jgi:hypothetical protein
MFENRMLRRIFGPERDEVIGGWRKFHNDELYKFYFSQSIIKMLKSRKMNWTCHVARIREKMGLVEMSEGETPPGRPRRMWEDNIKIDLGETRLYNMDWIDLAQDRDQWRHLVDMAMNLLVP